MDSEMRFHRKRKCTSSPPPAASSSNGKVAVYGAAPSTLADDDEGEPDSDCLRRVDAVIRRYSVAVTQEETRMDDALVKKFVDLHLGIDGSLTEASFVGFLTHVVSSFTAFAKSQPVFRSLDDHDQARLLFRNASLHVQYVLAGYFTAEGGLDQLHWILGLQVPVDVVTSKREFVKVYPQDFKEILSFARHPHTMTVYGECAIEVRRNFACSHLYNGLVANMILYSQEDGMMLRERHRVRNIFQDLHGLLEAATKRLAGAGGPAVNSRQVLHSLQAMNDIFSNCYLKLDEQIGKKAVRLARRRRRGESVPHVPLGFTMEDRAFLGVKYDAFNAKFRSVEACETFMNIYLPSAAGGVEISTIFLPTAIRMFVERFRATFYDLTDSCGLQHGEQQRLWSRNCALAVAFNILKMETAESGHQQLDFARGELDGGNDLQNAAPLDLKFLDMRAVCAGRLKDQDLSLYHLLVKKIGPIMRDGISFMLVTMITMLNEPECDVLPFASPEKIALEKQLIRLLQHHQRERLLDGQVLNQAHFRMLLRYVKGISQFVPRLAS